MNNGCRKKDCRFIDLCMAMIDIEDCGVYRSKGEISPLLKGIAPRSEQTGLFQQGSEGNEEREV